jgi:site-specific DNA recombinase
MTAALYIRVSTNEQTEYSPKAQRRLLLEYAKNHGYQTKEEFIYVDEGISGRTAAKRSAFLQMISRAKEKPKPFDVILVHKFDRFARSREDSIVYKSLLKNKYQIKVISITEHLNEDKFSVILEAMLEAMAEYYSLNLSEEVNKGMTEKARQGGFQAKPPYGYSMSDQGNLLINQEEAAVVRSIFSLYADEKMSPSKIAVLLNQYGYRTKKNNPFKSRTVQYILQNPTYKGYILWNRRKNSTKQENPSSQWIYTKGKHEPIVDETLFNQIQHSFSSAKKTDSLKSGASHWLSGFLRCGCCKGRLCITSRQNGITAFQCSSYTKGNCSVSHYIKETAIYPALSASLKKICRNTGVLLSLSDTDSAAVYSLAQNSLAEIEKQQTNAKLAYLSGIDSLEEYRSTKKILEKRRQTILSSVSSQSAEELQPTCSSPFDFFTGPSSDWKKAAVLHSILEKIVYEKENSCLAFYYDPFIETDHLDDPMGF